VDISSVNYVILNRKYCIINFILRVKEQGTRLNLREPDDDYDYDDDDDDDDDEYNQLQQKYRRL
jgi:hypothetical protein